MLHSNVGLHLGIDACNIRQGGGITHLSQLLNEANPEANGFKRVTVWTPKATAKYLPTQPWLSVHSLPWMEGALPIRLVGQHLLLPREIKKSACNVLFSPGGTIPLLCTTPCVTMSQNMLPFEPSEAIKFGRFSLMRLKMGILHYAQLGAFKRAESIIFLSEYAKNVIFSALKPMQKKFCLVPHGIESRFVQACKQQHSLLSYNAQNPFRLLYVSILMPYKHQCEVALAVAQLRAEGLPVDMTFVGASWGGYTQKFEATLKALDPNSSFLHWKGALPFENLHNEYKRADAFVFASSCENMPNILIEAMAAGLPIACSDKGPMPEFLGDAGVYFNPEKAESIAESLRLLLKDEHLRLVLATKACARVQQLSWSRCAQQTFGFIQQVVGELKKTAAR